MKKTFLSLLLATLSYYCNAQNLFPPNGDVTIGTNNTSQFIKAPYSGGAIEIRTNSATTDRGLSLGLIGNDHTTYLPYLTIAQDGKVGIGTTAPAGKLHIAGPLDGSTAALILGDASPGNLNVPIGSSPGGYNIDFHTWRDIVPDQIGARIRAERINSYIANNALVQSMDLTFSTSYGSLQSQLTEKMRIRSDGAVGIGTVDTKGYLLAVNGSAIATSMTVKLYANWPDYVFKKTYQLPSLLTVKAFIDKNSHLPDMPSAQEVKDKGINLGEMVKFQTKKIEELTLYMIKLQEQNTELRKELIKTKRRNHLK